MKSSHLSICFLESPITGKVFRVRACRIDPYVCVIHRSAGGRARDIFMMVHFFMISAPKKSAFFLRFCDDVFLDYYSQLRPLAHSAFSGRLWGSFCNQSGQIWFVIILAPKPAEVWSEIPHKKSWWNTLMIHLASPRSVGLFFFYLIQINSKKWILVPILSKNEAFLQIHKFSEGKCVWSCCGACCPTGYGRAWAMIANVD